MFGGQQKRGAPPTHNGKDDRARRAASRQPKSTARGVTEAFEGDDAPETQMMELPSSASAQPEQSESGAGLRARFTTSSLANLPPPPVSETPRVPGQNLQKHRTLLERLRTSFGVPLEEGQHGSKEAAEVDPLHPDTDQQFMASVRVASSIFLQQLLFYRSYFDPCYIIATYWSLQFKDGTDDLRIVTLTLWFVFEPMRVYFGFSGNLQEKVPFLVLFMLITLFPMLPIAGYLGVEQPGIEPYDKALNTVYGLFLLVEMGACYHALRHLVRRQDEQFYLEDYEQQKAELTHGSPSRRRPIETDQPFALQTNHVYDTYSPLPVSVHPDTDR